MSEVLQTNTSVKILKLSFVLKLLSEISSEWLEPFPLQGYTSKVSIPWAFPLSN